MKRRRPWRVCGAPPCLSPPCSSLCACVSCDNPHRRRRRRRRPEAFLSVLRLPVRHPTPALREIPARKRRRRRDYDDGARWRSAFDAAYSSRRLRFHHLLCTVSHERRGGSVHPLALRAALCAELHHTTARLTLTTPLWLILLPAPTSLPQPATQDHRDDIAGAVARRCSRHRKLAAEKAAPLPFPRPARARARRGQAASARPAVAASKTTLISMLRSAVEAQCDS